MKLQHNHRKWFNAKTKHQKRIRKHSWIVRNPSMCVSVRLICYVHCGSTEYTLHHVLCYRICKQRHKPQRIITQQIKSRKFEQQEIADCWRKIKQQNTMIAYTNWRRRVTEIVWDFFFASLYFQQHIFTTLLVILNKKMCRPCHGARYTLQFYLWPAQFLASFSILKGRDILIGSEMDSEETFQFIWLERISRSGVTETD